MRLKPLEGLHANAVADYFSLPTFFHYHMHNSCVGESQDKGLVETNIKITPWVWFREEPNSEKRRRSLISGVWAVVSPHEGTGKTLRVWLLSESGTGVRQAAGREEG